MSILEEVGGPAKLLVSDADVAKATEVLNNARANAAMEMAATRAREAAASIELFGSFFLGDDEFALSAHCIREVVNFPEKITAIPLSPAFLEGVFTLRGHVIPVINLEKIFDAGASRADNTQKIAIVDYEKVQIGILFHRTGEILRVRPEQRCVLQYRDKARQSVIAGTIRLENGARLLEILDPTALIQIENVPQVLALQPANHRTESNNFHLQTERRQCVAFRVGGTAFAFEMNAIREIINVPELKDSVLHSELCLGRFNLRGNVVAVVDFAKLLNISNVVEYTNPERRIIIARIGEVSIGLLVDSVDNIFSFFPEDVLPIPLLSKTRAGMFGGCIYKDKIGEVIFLNHKEIFSSTEIVDMTKGHTDLYQQEALADTSYAKKNSASLHRQVYITFLLGDTYALEIRKIREIIDFSEHMIKPPSLPPFVHGILNLRRQMITVIDLRRLYQMPPPDNMSNRKILVIDSGDDHYGLMVDAVENIVTVTDRDRIDTPKIVRGNATTDLRSEMHEVIEMVAEGNARTTLSVFDIDVFLTRLTQEVPQK